MHTARLLRGKGTVRTSLLAAGTSQERIKQLSKGRKAPNPSPGPCSLLPCTVAGAGGAGAASQGLPSLGTPQRQRPRDPIPSSRQPNISVPASLLSLYCWDINFHIILCRSSFFLPPKD